MRSEQFAPGSAVEMAPVRVSAVLEHCAAMARALAQRQGVEIAAHIPENVAALTDELKLRSMVTNLLTNAAEYTPAGGRVTVTLEVLPARSTGDLNGRASRFPEGVEANAHDGCRVYGGRHWSWAFPPSICRTCLSRFTAATSARVGIGGIILGLGLFLWCAAMLIGARAAIAKRNRCRSQGAFVMRMAQAVVLRSDQAVARRRSGGHGRALHWRDRMADRLVPRASRPHPLIARMPNEASTTPALQASPPPRGPVMQPVHRPLTSACYAISPGG